MTTARMMSLVIEPPTPVIKTVSLVTESLEWWL